MPGEVFKNQAGKIPFEKNMLCRNGHEPGKFTPGR